MLVHTSSQQGLIDQTRPTAEQKQHDDMSPSPITYLAVAQFAQRSKLCNDIGSFVLPLDRSSADASWAEAVARRSSSESDSLMASSSVYASSLSWPLPLRPLFLQTWKASVDMTASWVAASGTYVVYNPHFECSGRPLRTYQS